MPNETHHTTLRYKISDFFSSLLERFLSPQAQTRFLTAPSKYKMGDVMDDPPVYYALKALPDTVPNPPVHVNDRQMPQQVKLWQDWIATHKDELSKLQPTGEGVDFSDKACKNGKPRKKH